jgi:hypothetical protein
MSDGRGQKSTFRGSLFCLWRFKGKRTIAVSNSDRRLVHQITPQRKEVGMQWKHPTSPRAKISKLCHSGRKVIWSVFLDAYGVSHAEAMPRGTAINADACKRQETLTCVARCYPSARRRTPHYACARRIRILPSFHQELLDRRLCGFDLGPSDWRVFGPLKQHLKVSDSTVWGSGNVCSCVTVFGDYAGRRCFSGVSELHLMF